MSSQSRASLKLSLLLLASLLLLTAPAQAQDFVWARAMGAGIAPGADSDVAFGVALDGSGNVHTVGVFRVPVDFDPGPGTFNLTSGSTFVSKLDSNGNFIWARGAAGVSGVALDGSGNVHTVASLHGTFDFDPGPGTFNLTSAGSTDIVVDSRLGPGDGRTEFRHLQTRQQRQLRLGPGDGRTEFRPR